MKVFSIMLFVCLSCIGYSQKSPVTWSIETKATAEEGIYEVIATADIAPSWVIYSKETEPDGPIPTSFEIESNDTFELIDEYTESKEPTTKYSDLFEIYVAKFDTEVSLVQKIKLHSDAAVIKAVVSYMTCSGDRCLPPTEVFLETNI